jgi:hypothetical protein
MGDERLDEVEHEIQHARHTAEEADILPDPKERHFYESGAESDVDDQTIAP